MTTRSRLPERLDSPAQEVDWEAVYAEQLPRVYNYFRYQVRDGAAAEDLTATTFEKAWRYRQRYRRDLAAFSTWLFTIARRVTADYFRRHRDEIPLEDLHGRAIDDSVEEIIQRRDEFARLSALLKRLPPREQELVALKYGAGLTNRAIAQLTGLSESNVGTILYRVVSQLRAEWEEQ